MLRRLVAAAVCLFTLTLLPRVTRAEGLDGAYQQAIDSVVWILSLDKDNKLSCGTGVLIDRERGYILSAYHVVDGDNKMVAACFPARDEDGALITDERHYTAKLAELFFHCDVIDKDPRRDLVLLKVKALPRTSRAMPIAVRSAKPGQTLFTVGNSAALSRRMLWGFASGNVRQVYENEYRFSGGQEIKAKIVEMTVPVNPGDSGGPIVNEHGELVGINSAMNPKENAVQNGIDVTEIWSFLRRQDRSLTLTLFDARNSSLAAEEKRRCYLIVSTRGSDLSAAVTHHFFVSADPSGRVTSTPVVAGAPSR